MSIRKAIIILFVLSVGMLALGAEPTSALFLENTEPPVDKVELEGQEPLAESVPLSGRIGTNFTIRNDGGLEEEEPAVAYSSDRQEYLVVWYNDRPGNDDIRGQRVSKNGTLIGGPFYISAGPGAERRYPDVAYNSKHDQYLVVWEHNDGLWNSIRTRRISGTGALLDTTDIVITSGSNIITPAKPAVEYAFTSDKYLVVWQETFHPLPLQVDILGRVVTSAGTPDGTSFLISKDPVGHPRREPDLAYNRARNEYLVAWQQEEGDYDIYARRVTGGGLPLNPASIEIGRYASEEKSPSVAAIPKPPGQGQFLVVWQLQHSATDADIYGRLVQGNGTTSSPFSINSSTEDQINPVVAGSESANRYLVAWSQSSSPPFFFNYIAGQEVSTSGSLVGGAKSVGGLNLADNAAITSGPIGDFLVTFEDQLAPSIDLGIYGQLWGNRAYLPITLRNH